MPSGVGYARLHSHNPLRVVGLTITKKSTQRFVPLKLPTKHEASRDLFATAELLVFVWTQRFAERDRWAQTSDWAIPKSKAN